MGEVREKVLVAMSGGVDSAAAACLLKEQGYDIVGVAMQVWDYRSFGGNSSRATCCAPGDFDDARVVAEAQGFPFYVFDFEENFRDDVINPFINSYLKGLTPNPCLDCNRKVKFSKLRQRARSLGIEQVATGHYARIRAISGDKKALFTAADLNKDQTYFLYAITQDELSATIFPVGDMVKSDVRNYLSSKGLSIAQKAESQDICFVPGSVSEFIRKEKQIVNTCGRIINTAGVELGSHEGIFEYTIGQRRGLGVSHSNPLYVVDIDSEKNEVVVGEKHELERSSFIVDNVNWISGVVAQKIKALVKLRYRHPGVICELESLSHGQVLVKFTDEWTPVSPGQAAVFYAVDANTDGAREVFGGGIIAKG